MPPLLPNPQAGPNPNLHPIQFPDPQMTLDNIFNNVIQQRLMQKKMQETDLAIQGQKMNLAQAQAQQNAQYGMFGTTPQEVAGATPEQFQAASQPAPMTPQPGQGQGMYANPGQPAQEDPIVSHIRNFVSAQKASYTMGVGQKQAELQKTQAEASQAQAMASLMGGGNGQNGVSDAIGSGRASPELAMNMLGRSEARTPIALSLLKNPNLNLQQLQNQQDMTLAGKKSSAELTQGGSSQEMARAANSAYKQFDLLQSASDNFTRSNNQLINTPLLKIETSQSPEAQVLKTALSTARIEYARAASGSKSPSDTFMAEAKNALPDGITAKQIGPVLDQLRNSLAEQSRGQLSPADLASTPPIINKSGKQKFASAADVKAAFQAGKIDRAGAKSALAQFGYK